MRIIYLKKAFCAFSFLAVFLVHGSVLAQIADGSLPASFSINLKSANVLPQRELNPVNKEERIALDKAEGVQNRYGVLENLELNIKEAGVYSQYGDQNIWQYELSCEDALSLGLFFSTYDIPQGAALYIYTPDRQIVRGAFTWANKKDNGGLTLADLQGNTLIIEYNEPILPVFEGGVILGAVVKAYQSFEANTNERIQINCPEGDDWQNEKRAVCMITFNDSQYSYYCSGALVNNTLEDGSAYFLTANHCISSSTEAATLIAYFNYENSTCEASDGTLSQSLSGASLLASNSYSDFTLLQLDEYPPREYQPYFAGWDASGDQPETGTCIHHPQGTAKCIALDYGAPTSVDYSVRWDDGTVSQVNSHWEVTYDVGIDEGGSSGGPLFDENKRIKGQLHGGDENSSLFGKFSLSWDYRSETNRQLKHWLDPDDTGITQMDGLEGYSKPVAAFSPEVTIMCLDEAITLNDESKYEPESWSWEISPASFSFVNGTSVSSQNPEVQFLTEGVYTVQLTVANENGSDVLVKSNLIAVYAQLPVLFTELADEMTMCGWELDNYQFVAEGAPGFNFELTAAANFDQSVSENILTLSLNDEGKQGGSFDTYVKVTGTQGSCAVADSILLHVIVPENDNVAQALPLKLGYNGSYSNECGTVQDNEAEPETNGCTVVNNWCPPSSNEVLDNSIWFTFTGPSSGAITIEAEGFSSQIAIYRAATANYLLSGSKATYTLVAAADYGLKSTTNATILNSEVIPGGKYWLQVDGVDGAEGDLDLNLLTNSVEVYPNPSSGLYHLTVASVSDGDAELSVYSQTGQLIYSGVGSFNQQENMIDFDLSNNPSGVYYFRAIINGAIMSKKLILVK
ncbi:T9SS type A sorting domain-containing protein [Mangrovibacterium lignilyticum]|uniref:T9SS type A sorting domain-containing protein n=1 Tax=Mangrovibacterium lignilyticum TaxID=2668052 RepID=UPI0013D39C8D|nr:T9SS type A sorting domain-containing protein [Mangrovibacterium lignilyticum]